MDSDLVSALQNVINLFFILLIAYCTVIYSVWYIVFPMIAFVAVIYFIQNIFRTCKAEIVRIESQERSFLYSYVSEINVGISSVHTYGKIIFFNFFFIKIIILGQITRIFSIIQKKIDCWSKFFHQANLINIWLIFRVN
jgi:hypothetical protein